MPRPLKDQYMGFLDYLFGCEIRWITHSSNENAKKLYDRIAKNTGFDLYELKND